MAPATAPTPVPISAPLPAPYPVPAPTAAPAPAPTAAPPTVPHPVATSASIETPTTPFSRRAFIAKPSFALCDAPDLSLILHASTHLFTRLLGWWGASVAPSTHTRRPRRGQMLGGE